MSNHLARSPHHLAKITALALLAACLLGLVALSVYARPVYAETGAVGRMEDWRIANSALPFQPSNLPTF